MDEVSKLLEDIVVSQQQPPTPSLESSHDPPLVDEVVGSIQSLVDPTLPLKSEMDTAHIFSCHFIFLRTRGYFIPFNETHSKN
jgi:hypothetical protein